MIPREVSLSRLVSALRLATTCFSYAAASAAVSVGFPANSGGRSIGVTVRKSQIPCMSGFPSGVRGGVHLAPALDEVDRAGAWPETETAAIDRTGTIQTEASTRCRMGTSRRIVAIRCGHVIAWPPF